MFTQKKITDRRIWQSIKMLFILTLVLLMSLNGYSQDLNADLIEAVLKNDTATTRFLLAKGADISTRDQIYGKTLLHLAVEKGHKDMVQLLITKGDAVNAMDEVNGWTPMHQAAQRDDTEMVQLLIAVAST